MFFLPYLRKLDNGMKNGFDNPPHICLEGYFFEGITMFVSFPCQGQGKDTPFSLIREQYYF